MKKILILTTSLIISLQGFAQTTSLETLKSENNKLKSLNQSLQEEVTGLKKQNDYFRETLKILETKIKTVSDAKIDCTLLSCEGDSKNQSIKAQFLLTNHDVKKNLLFSPDRYAEAIDLQGNAIKPDNINSGPVKYSADILTDTPLKITVEFSAVLPSVALLKMLSLNCSTTNDFKKVNFLFNDISVNWK